MDFLETTDIERAFWAYDRTSASNTVTVAQIEGSSDPTLWRQALESVSRRQPYLRHRFSPDGRTLIPTREPASTLEVDESAKGAWVRVVEQELGLPFDPASGPLVRGRVLRGPESGSFRLLICLPHLISDGRCSFRFLRDVVVEADRRLSGGTFSPDAPVAFLRPSTSALDPRRGQPPNWSFPVSEGGGALLTTQPFPPVLSAAPGDPAERTGLTVLSLGPRTTRSVQNLAASRGVSVNAWLTASAIVALGTSWPQMRVTSALDVRGLLGNDPLGSRPFGMWAGRFTLYVAPSEQGVAEIAAAFHRGTFQILRRSAFHGLYELAGLASGPISLPGLPSLKVTNHGDLDEEGFEHSLAHLTLKGLRGFTALHRGWNGEAGWGMVPSVFQGRLQLTFARPVPAMSEEAARERADRIIGIASQEADPEISQA